MAKQVYNRFFDKEKWDKVNKWNKNALEDFNLELKSQRKSPQTIKQYNNDIRIFFIWVYDEFDNCPIYNLKKKQLRKFILDMTDKGMSPARVNRMKSCISSLYTYLEDDDECEEVEMNHMSKVKSVQKEEVREIIFLTTEEVDAIRNRLLKEEKYQLCLFLDIATETGIRHNEIHQIKKDWIVKDKNYTTNKVIGKRRKQFYVPIHDRTRESYDLYMQQRGEDDIEELWINYRGEPLSYEGMYNWVLYFRKILEEETGEYKEINVHSFRHFYIDGMIKGYHPLCKKYGRKFTLQEVQVMVSHSSSETTNLYCKKDDEEIINKAFGWDN